MRLAIGRISDGDNSEMKKKMEVMLQSVVKIENGIVSFMPNKINIVICCL